MSVQVEKYNPEWPQHFQALESELRSILVWVQYIAIEHVGSTAVPGLAAKPIIDVDIIVARENVQPAITALVTQGRFDYLGELGIVDRHAFRHPPDLRSCNIYVCVDGAAQTRNHLGLRDTLRRDEKLRDEYARLKLDLASKETNIIDYTEAKSEVIQKILNASNILSEDELIAINTANHNTERFKALHTRRLLLREFVARDANGYFELEGNEENARYQDWPPRTVEQSRQLVLDNIRCREALPRTIVELAVEHQGHFVGRVGAKIQPHVLDRTSNEITTTQILSINLWFSFLPAIQGKGLATEAMTAFIDALVNRRLHAPDIRRLEFEIECDPRNERSWKLAERLGFARHSLTLRAWESKGEWVDSLVYRKVIEERSS